MEDKHVARRLIPNKIELAISGRRARDNANAAMISVSRPP